jgi:uncharacterized membrane protein YraQ (UPF0718 family)
MLNETELIGGEIFPIRPRTSLTELGEAIIGAALIIVFIGILIIFATVSNQPIN